MNDDKKTITACLSGNYQEFAMLVDKYKSLVCSIAYSTTGDFDTSEYIAQDVFINAWKNLPTLQNHTKFKPWLTSITRDTTAFYANKLENSSQTSILDTTYISFTPNTSEDPAEVNMIKEENAMLWQILEAIELDCREALVIYYRHDKSTKQVAELLSISSETATQRISHGKDLIKAKMEHKLETCLRNASPDDKFTASVIATTSTITIGVAGNKVSAPLAVSSSPIVQAISKIISTVAFKVAAFVIVIIATVTLCYLESNKTAPTTNPVNAAIEPIQQPTKPLKTEKPAVMATVKRKQTTEPAIALFAPIGVLSGRITSDKTAEPVMDARVVIKLPNEEFTETETNEDGLYYFDSISTHGKCTLNVYSTEYIGFGDEPVVIELTENKQTVRHFELEDACMIEIEVTDESGNPIKNATVLVIEQNHQATNIVNYYGNNKTDADGKVVTGGIKPSSKAYTIAVIGDEADENLTRKDVYMPTYITATLSDPEVIETRKIVLKKDFIIEGYLFDNDNKPRPQFPLEIETITLDTDSDQTTQTYQGITDESGYYKFENLPFSNTFYVKLPSQYEMEGVSRRKIELEDKCSLRVDLGGSNFVAGRILLNSTILVDAKLAICDSEDYFTADFINNAYTDADGMFAFSGISQGKKFLVIFPDQTKNEFVLIMELDTRDLDLHFGDILINTTDMKAEDNTTPNTATEVPGQ